LAVTAAPAFGPNESLALTLAVVVPARFSTPQLQSIIEDELRETTARLSVDLGVHPKAPAEGVERVARRGRPRST